jgi:hypothetical protein
MSQLRAGVPTQRPKNRLKELVVWGVKEAVVADFNEAIGQNVLQETGQELQDRQGQPTGLLFLTALAQEGDLAVFQFDQASVGEGHAVDIEGPKRCRAKKI